MYRSLTKVVENLNNNKNVYLYDDVGIFEHLTTSYYYTVNNYTYDSKTIEMLRITKSPTFKTFILNIFKNKSLYSPIAGLDLYITKNDLIIQYIKAYNENEINRNIKNDGLPKNTMYSALIKYTEKRAVELGKTRIELSCINSVYKTIFSQFGFQDVSKDTTSLWKCYYKMIDLQFL